MSRGLAAFLFLPLQASKSGDRLQLSSTQHEEHTRVLITMPPLIAGPALLWTYLKWQRAVRNPHRRVNSPTFLAHRIDIVHVDQVQVRHHLLLTLSYEHGVQLTQRLNSQPMKRGYLVSKPRSPKPSSSPSRSSPVNPNAASSSPTRQPWTSNAHRVLVIIVLICLFRRCGNLERARGISERQQHNLKFQPYFYDEEADEAVWS
jgi:hypothetical protein